MNETNEMIVPAPNVKPKRMRRIVRKRKKKKNSHVVKSSKPKISMTSYDIGLTNGKQRMVTFHYRRSSVF